MFKKILQYNKSVIIIFVISILAIKIATIITNYYRSKPLDLAENYETVIASRAEEKGKYVYVKIADVPYIVATETIGGSTTNEYYVVYDENDYMYVVKLKDSTYKTICDEFEKNKDNFSYTITGRLANVEYDLEKIIIDKFNESYEDVTLSTYNYNQYFGTTYLNETAFSTNETIIAISELCRVAAGIIAVLYLIIIVKGIINTKKSIKSTYKMELNDELSKTEVIEYSNAKIILSDNYFISMYVGMIANKYSDIAWVYLSHNPKTRLGISYNNYNYNFANKSNMIVYLKDGRKYYTATVKIKEVDVYVEIINELSKKNPNIMIGYTYENLAKYKKIKTENKNM